MRPGLKTSPKETAYAKKLMALIVEMAEMETNIILQLFPPETAIIYDQKYPRQSIKLFNNQLSVYYHAHEKNLISEEEHGHFHFFVTANLHNESQAQHLIALSIDHYGQPRAWFSVNEWVTAKASYDSYLFNHIISSKDEEGTIQQNWLSAMLLYYQQDIVQLLNNSLDTLQSYENRLSQAKATVRENRDIYFLCESKINLSYDLTHSLQNTMVIK